MSPARANQLLLQGFPQPAATAQRIPQYTTPSGAVPPMALSPSQLSAARSQQRATAGPIMPLEQAAMRGASIPPGPRLAPPAPRPMQAIGDAFRQPLTSPTGQGLAAAALTGLDYAGPQLQPTSIGQGLARMGAAGLQAFTQAKQAEAAAEQAKFERAYKTADLQIKAQKAAGSGMFKGSGFKAGAFNMLIDLAPKVEAGTATAPEMQAYSLAYGEAAAPRTIRSFDDQGNETIETIPGANMSQFPKPPGYVEPEVTTRPSPETVKTSKFASQLGTMGMRLNQYRNLLMAETFDRKDMLSGAGGFPTDEMAKASTVAEVLRLDLKNLYELGALVGGDFQILDNLLTSPNSAKAAKAGKTALLLQLDQLERTVQDKLKEKEQAAIPGLYLNPVEITSRDQWDSVPIGGYAVLPNGEIVYKER